MPTPTPPQGHVKVPSKDVTPTMLREWGFPVQQAEKSMGEVIVTHPGSTFEKARHDAWAAGFTVLATPRTDADRPWVAKAQREPDWETLAWAARQKGQVS